MHALGSLIPMRAATLIIRQNTDYTTPNLSCSGAAGINCCGLLYNHVTRVGRTDLPPADWHTARLGHEWA
jgi:hypothetical protein